MTKSYSYSSYINQFRTAKQQAEKFILSLDKITFLQRPGENTWCIAECYSHLINFGEIYYRTIQDGLENITNKPVAKDIRMEFPPRWFWKLAVSFFEPPYKVKVNTFAPFEPDTVSVLTKENILDKFIELQDRFIMQLEKAELQRLELNGIKVQHPMFAFLKMTLSECYAIAGAHQRRHQWQAEQVLDMLNSK